MAAANSDLFRKGGANTVTTLAAPGKALAATSITVGSTTNYPTDTGIVIGIRQVDSDGVLVPGTYSEYNATVTSGTTFSIDAVPVLGSDQVYPAGSTTQVFLPVSSSAHNDLIDGLVVSHDQDGTLKTDSVDSTQIKANAITTPKLADGSVTADKVDFTTGIWWEEIGRATLSSASDTITVSSLPARKYLRVLVSSLATGGTIDSWIRFNNDTASNYGRRHSSNGGADSVSATSSVLVNIGAGAFPQYMTLDIVNIATQEKLAYITIVTQNTAGAGSAPNKVDGVGKWANTTDQINRIDVINGGTGDFAIGSEIVVLGHN